MEHNLVKRYAKKIECKATEGRRENLRSTEDNLYCSLLLYSFHGPLWPEDFKKGAQVFVLKIFFLK
jgi:hypothetical protein